VLAGDVPVTYFGGESKPGYIVGKGGAVRDKRGKGVGHITLLADGAKNVTENSDTVVSSLMMEQSQSKSFINILAVKAHPTQPASRKRREHSIGISGVVREGAVRPGTETGELARTFTVSHGGTRKEKGNDCRVRTNIDRLADTAQNPRRTDPARPGPRRLRCQAGIGIIFCRGKMEQTLQESADQLLAARMIRGITSA
jgi:hypothetical protein